MISEEMLILEAWDLLAAKGITQTYLVDQPAQHRELIQLGIQAGLMAAVVAHTAEIKALEKKWR